MEKEAKQKLLELLELYEVDIAHIKSELGHIKFLLRKEEKKDENVD